jgi:hypothetical protein
MSKSDYALTPIKPIINAIDYQKYIGDIIERLTTTTGILESLYRYAINDTTMLDDLKSSVLIRRTRDMPYWQGASGCKHQIDESFSTFDEKIILLVECKRWRNTVDFPSICTILIRLIDIGKLRPGSTILGMMVTTQGYKGKLGGKEKERTNIGKIIGYFNQMDIYLILQQVPDIS